MRVPLLISVLLHCMLVWRLQSQESQWGARQNEVASTITIFNLPNKKSNPKKIPIPIEKQSKTSDLRLLNSINKSNGQSIQVESNQIPASLTLKDVMGYGNTPPEYPPVALRKGWEGTVAIRLHLTAAGSTYKVDLIRSSGFEVLDDAALKTAQTWILPIHSLTETEKEVRVEFKFLD